MLKDQFGFPLPQLYGQGWTSLSGYVPENLTTPRLGTTMIGADAIKRIHDKHGISIQYENGEFSARVVTDEYILEIRGENPGVVLAGAVAAVQEMDRVADLR